MVFSLFTVRLRIRVFCDTFITRCCGIASLLFVVYWSLRPLASSHNYLLLRSKTRTGKNAAYLLRSSHMRKLQLFCVYIWLYFDGILLRETRILRSRLCRICCCISSTIRWNDSELMVYVHRHWISAGYLLKYWLNIVDVIKLSLVHVGHGKHVYGECRIWMATAISLILRTSLRMTRCWKLMAFGHGICDCSHSDNLRPVAHDEHPDNNAGHYLIRHPLNLLQRHLMHHLVTQPVHQQLLHQYHHYLDQHLNHRLSHQLMPDITIQPTNHSRIGYIF